MPCSSTARPGTTVLSRGSLLAQGLRAARGLGSDPVDIFALIRDLGVRLHAGPSGETSEDLDGMYVRRDGVAFIFVNTDRWLRRQRLTAAHELGHHFLIGDQEASVEISDWQDTAAERAEERDAFDFARELMMDRTWMRNSLSALPIDEAIERTVRRFEVSPDAAAVRLCELDFITVAQKDRFLENQRDDATRLSVRPTPRPTHETAVDEVFARRLDTLERAGVISPERAEELRRHARPDVV
jgi:Zn-dependent peptidase ImmA (M78 family)